MGYQSKIADQLIEKGRLLNKQSDRKPIYQKLYQEIAKDLPYIFLYYPDVITGINKRVKGLSNPGPTGLLNPIENIYIVP